MTILNVSTLLQQFQKGIAGNYFLNQFQMLPDFQQIFTRNLPTLFQTPTRLLPENLVTYDYRFSAGFCATKILQNSWLPDDLQKRCSMLLLCAINTKLKVIVIFLLLCTITMPNIGAIRSFLNDIFELLGVQRTHRYRQKKHVSIVIFAYRSDQSHPLDGTTGNTFPTSIRSNPQVPTFNRAFPRAL